MCTYYVHLRIYSEFHGGSRGDRSDRMELEQEDGAEMRTRIEELEQANADMLEQNKDLREQITGFQACNPCCVWCKYLVHPL